MQLVPQLLLQAAAGLQAQACQRPQAVYEAGRSEPTQLRRHLQQQRIAKAGRQRPAKLGQSPAQLLQLLRRQARQLALRRVQQARQAARLRRQLA